MSDTNKVTIPVLEDDIHRFRIGYMLNGYLLAQTKGRNKFILLDAYRKLVDDLLAALIKENLLTIHETNVGEDIKLELRLDVLSDSRIKGIMGATLGHTIQCLRDKIDDI